MTIKLLSAKRLKYPFVCSDVLYLTINHLRDDKKIRLIQRITFYPEKLCFAAICIKRLLDQLKTKAQLKSSYRIKPVQDYEDKMITHSVTLV